MVPVAQCEFGGLIWCVENSASRVHFYDTGIPFGIL